jgi:hypothetical protein
MAANLTAGNNQNYNVPSGDVAPGPGIRLMQGAQPDIVMVQAHGWPSDGPDANKPAYDDVIQAGSGIAHTFQLQSGTPALAPTLVADKVSGLTLVYAILAALFHRLAVADVVNALEGGNNFFVVCHHDDRRLRLLRHLSKNECLLVFLIEFFLSAMGDPPIKCNLCNLKKLLHGLLHQFSARLNPSKVPNALDDFGFVQFFI